MAQWEDLFVFTFVVRFDSFVPSIASLELTFVCEELINSVLHVIVLLLFIALNVLCTCDKVSIKVIVNRETINGIEHFKFAFI